MRTLPVLGAVLTALVLAPVAFAADEDGGLWATTAVAKRFNDQISADFTLQFRFDDDIGRLERTLLRPSVSYHAAGNQVLSLGYDAHLIDAPRNLAEQRLWQQYQVARVFAPITAALRIRLEERFIDHVDGLPVRVRLKAGVKVPLQQSPWHFSLANEAFIGLNDTARSQPDGFHENRAFAGFGRKLSERASLEVGYQNQFLDGRTRDRMIHQLMLGVAFKLP